MEKYIDAEKLIAEIERLYKEHSGKYGCDEVAITLDHLEDFIDSLLEEKPSEDLNDEIKKFIEEYGYERGEDKLLIAIVARHFAEWQKEQMMKDAVEGEVIYDLGGFFRIKSEAIDGAKYKVGSWVKLIIVKED